MARLFKTIKMCVLFTMLSSVASAAETANPLAFMYDAKTMDSNTCLSTFVQATDYMVPLDDQKDVSVAFLMKNVSYQRCGQLVQVKYELPETLTGIKNVVRMAGTFQSSTNSLELSGDHGSASCVPRTDGAMKCDVKFQNLQLNPNLASELLKQNQQLSAHDLQNKLDAIGRFTGNPIGFFTMYPPALPAAL